MADESEGREERAPDAARRSSRSTNENRMRLTDTTGVLVLGVVAVVLAVALALALRCALQERRS